MVDVQEAALQPVHPLAPWTAAFAELPTGVELRAEPLVAAVSLRVAPGPVADAVAGLLGVGLPPAGRWVPTRDGASSAETGRVVWLGPDEWLVSRSGSTPEALEELLRETVVPHGGSATDVSANRVGIRVSGLNARELLSGGCSIDLHPKVFGAGAAAVTTLANSSVVLLSLSETGDDHVLLVRSSFARHLADWLIDAALEFSPVG